MTAPGSSLPNAPMLTMRCPKCGGDMVSFERSGVIVDGCRECRGIFLDRSELERLVDAEGGAQMASAARAMPAAAPTWPGERERGPRGGFADERPRPFRGDWHDDDDDDDRDDRGDWRERDRDDRDRRRDPRGSWDDRPAPRRRSSILGSLLEGFGD